MCTGACWSAMPQSLQLKHGSCSCMPPDKQPQTGLMHCRSVCTFHRKQEDHTETWQKACLEVKVEVKCMVQTRLLTSTPGHSARLHAPGSA